MTPEEMAKRCAAIMGWIEGKHSVFARLICSTLDTFDEEYVTRSTWFDSNGALICFYSDWSPAERIQDADVLIAWLDNRGWVIELLNSHTGGNPWTLILCSPDQDYDDATIEHDQTRPLVITRAFLRAHGEEP